MATNISSDISTNINITTRKNDSFYLKMTLSNDDGTAFSLNSYTVYQFRIFDSSSNVLKEFSYPGSASTGTNEVHKPGTITRYNGQNSLSPGEIIIEVPSITVNSGNGDDAGMYFNNNLPVGSYDYTFVLKSGTEVHTILHGKFKSVD